MHKTGQNDTDIFNLLFRDGTNNNSLNVDRSETPGPSPPKLFKYDDEQQERTTSVIQETFLSSPAPPILKPIPLMGNNSALLANLFTPTMEELMELYRRLPFFASWTIANTGLSALLAQSIQPKMEEWVDEFARGRLFSVMPGLRDLDESIITNFIEALKRFDGINLPGFPSPIETSSPFPLSLCLPQSLNIHKQILLSTFLNQDMTRKMLPNPLELLEKMGLPKDILSPSSVSESLTPSYFANLPGMQPVFKVPKLKKIGSPKKLKAAVPAQ